MDDEEDDAGDDDDDDVPRCMICNEKCDEKQRRQHTHRFGVLRLLDNSRRMLLVDWPLAPQAPSEAQHPAFAPTTVCGWPGCSCGNKLRVGGKPKDQVHAPRQGMSAADIKRATNTTCKKWAEDPGMAASMDPSVRKREWLSEHHYRDTFGEGPSSKMSPEMGQCFKDAFNASGRGSQLRKRQRIGPPSNPSALGTSPLPASAAKPAAAVVEPPGASASGPLPSSVPSGSVVKPHMGHKAAGNTTPTGGGSSTVAAAAAGSVSGKGSGPTSRKRKEPEPDAPAVKHNDAASAQPPRIPRERPYLRLRLGHGTSADELRQLGHEVSAHPWVDLWPRQQYLFGHDALNLVGVPKVTQQQREEAARKCRRHIGNTYLSSSAPPAPVGTASNGSAPATLLPPPPSTGLLAAVAPPFVFVGEYADQWPLLTKVGST